ncbi:hypothetical protein I552_3442 [Mycobacterium xenopi 3993]|nr:hypothetical protein I552_3442 [Mycobacterium xenopi 3993]
MGNQYLHHAVLHAIEQQTRAELGHPASNPPLCAERCTSPQKCGMPGMPPPIPGMPGPPPPWPMPGIGGPGMFGPGFPVQESPDLASSDPEC